MTEKSHPSARSVALRVRAGASGWVAIVAGGALALFASELLSQSEPGHALAEFSTGEPMSAANVNARFQSLQRELESLRAELRCGTEEDIMVRVGTLCVDKYEASVWSEPGGKGTQFGHTVAVPEVAYEEVPDAGVEDTVVDAAVPHDPDDYPCSDNGNDCSKAAEKPIYAASIVGVTPSRYITWFQAQQACANSGKRLLTNAEWQMAASGTPDTVTVADVVMSDTLALEEEERRARLEPGSYGDDGVSQCATLTTVGGQYYSANGVSALVPGAQLPAKTGSRSACVSQFGVNDMVGNLWEWVADWTHGTGAPRTGISNELYGHDAMENVKPASSQGGGQNMPAAIYRGANGRDWFRSGVFAYSASRSPAHTRRDDIGFRCAK